MKKSLIALAALGYFGTAMAQSSVTLYGVADAAIGKAKSSGDTRVNMKSASIMNNGSSRVGIRGVEDLGGGLKAGFNFETGLSLEDGTPATAGGGFWGRHSYAWLAGNWGTFKMGRTLNPSFYGAAAWELTGFANYSVIANTFGAAGTNGRNNSQLAYKTPNLGGFSAELGYVFKDDNGGNQKWDVNAIYTGGPVRVGLSVNKTKSAKTNYALGGKYEFGNFLIAASYQSINPTANMRRRGVSIGGTARLSNFSLTLDLTRDTKNDLGKKYTNGLVEGKYALSKRTFLYAAYLRLNGDNNYSFGMRHNF